MTHSLTIILIILTAGLLGGLTNFLRLYKMSYVDRESRIIFFKSILMGVCASAAVPLFLQIIQTNLLEIQDGASFPEKNYFVLFGFCVVAAIYSKTFLENVNRKINQLEKETEEAKGKVKQLEKETEEAKRMSADAKNEMEESKSEIISDVKKQSEILKKFGKEQYALQNNDVEKIGVGYLDREHTMLAVASSVTFEDNIKYNIYYDPATRVHKTDFKYLGLYKSWAIRRIGRVMKTVYCDYDAEKDILVSTREDDNDFDKLTTGEIIRIKEIINSTEYYELETGNRFFLVDNFYETEYMLDSPVQGKQYFWLNEFKGYNPQLSAQEVAQLLSMADS